MLVIPSDACDACRLHGPHEFIQPVNKQGQRITLAKMVSIVEMPSQSRQAMVINDKSMKGMFLC